MVRIKERSDGKGFGFTLLGQFVGGVEPGSPAEAAGLRDGDRLVEVNGVNVENYSHKDVAMEIVSISNEITLLVVENEGYEHHYAKGAVVTAGLLKSCISRSSSGSEQKSSAGKQFENTICAMMISLNIAKNCPVLK